MIDAATLLSAMLIGLAGSVHCVGMCGGIVGAFGFVLPQDQNKWPYMLAYNSGRIVSYMIAGAITGGLGSIAANQISQGLSLLQLLSGGFLLLLGFYIGNWWRLLSKLEQVGKSLWNRISPWSKHFLPFKSPLQAIPYGMIWGWLPCGLVYSALTWSLASGSSVAGAVVMLFFGLGTLPALLLMGATGSSIKTFLQNPIVRNNIALLLCLAGLWIIYQAIRSLL